MHQNSLEIACRISAKHVLDILNEVDHVSVIEKIPENNHHRYLVFHEPSEEILIHIDSVVWAYLFASLRVYGEIRRANNEIWRIWRPV